MVRYLLVLLFFAGFTNGAIAQGTGNLVKAVFVDENNVKWFGTDRGLLSYDGTDWTAYNVRVDQPGMVSSLAYDDTEGMLIGTDRGYLEADNGTGGIQTAYVYNTMTMEVHDQLRDTVITSDEASITLGEVGDVLYDEYLTKYVINENGMLVLEGQRRIWLEKGYGLPENGLTLQPPHVLGFEKDTVYIGTALGVGRISPYTFKLGYYEDESLVISEDEIDGYTGASYYVQPYSGLASDDVRSILTDEDGYQWFGTTNGVSLHTVQNGLEGWTLNLSESDGLADNQVNVIFQDAGGDLWFGTEGGVSKYVISEGTFTNYSTSDGLTDNVIYDIAEDQDNTLWFATANGVSSFNGSTFTNFTTADQAKDFVSVIVNSVYQHQAAHEQLQVYPNPASDVVYLHFRKDRDMFIEAAVYDISGKRIMPLYSGYAGGGDLKVHWNLQKEQGGRVASGIYFIQVDDGRIVHSQKVVVLQ